MKYNIASIIFLSVVFGLLSCVPNKKIAYLQYKNEFREPASIMKDSLIRKYNTAEFSYRLQTGDLLDIKISTMTPLEINPFNDADKGLVAGSQYSMSPGAIQSTGYYIGEDGKINLPVVGILKVEGLLIGQAEDTLEAEVAKYLNKPVVRIKLQNFRYSVLGEVEQEATITSNDNNLTMLQAIAMAGGPSEFSDMSRVKVIRNHGNEASVFYVNLLSEDFLSSPFYFVQPDDVIVITPLKQRSYLKYAGQNLSILLGSVSLLVAVISLL